MMFSGSHPAVLRAYACLHALGSFLAMLREPSVVPGFSNKVGDMKGKYLYPCAISQAQDTYLTAI